MTTELRGTELLRAVVNHIISHPETWDQSQWHCGTTHCVAGHAQIMGGRPPFIISCYKDAKAVLGITSFEADWLFDAPRTLLEIHAFADIKLRGERYFDESGYDPDGFDRFGMDKDGFDRRGFNIAGYDRHGFNAHGVDRDGYDREGFNSFGRNRLGVDRDGFNILGLDREGNPLPLL